VKKKAHWIFGPRITGPWLQTLLQQPVDAIRAGLAIWYVANARNDLSDMTVSQKMQKRFLLNAKTFSKGLTHLEKADLVTATRCKGRKPQIAIVGPFQSSRKKREYVEAKREYGRLGWVFLPIIPGKSLHKLRTLSRSAIRVGLAAYHQAQLRKKRYDPQDVVLDDKTKKRFGISNRMAFKRGLKALMQAELVEVHNRHKQQPLITILGFFSKLQGKERVLYHNGMPVIGWRLGYGLVYGPLRTPSRKPLHVDMDYGTVLGLPYHHARRLLRDVPIEGWSAAVRELGAPQLAQAEWVGLAEEERRKQAK